MKQVVVISSILMSLVSMSSSASELDLVNPFGIEIGKTTCREAEKILNDPDGVYELNLNKIPASLSKKNPDGYKPGHFSVTCKDGADFPVTSAELGFAGTHEKARLTSEDVFKKYKLIKIKSSNKVKRTLELEGKNGVIVVSPPQTVYGAEGLDVLSVIRYYTHEVFYKDISKHL